MRIDEIDKALELATVIRAGEIGFVRDYRRGFAFGRHADALRIDAYTLGTFDALAHHLSPGEEALPLLAYLHCLLSLGPGKRVRRAYREMTSLADKPECTRYLAGGRRHVLQTIMGNAPKVGRFAELLAEELSEE